MNSFYQLSGHFRIFLCITVIVLYAEPALALPDSTTAIAADTTHAVTHDSTQHKRGYFKIQRESITTSHDSLFWERNNHCFGIGIGWLLGSNGLFSQWSQGLVSIPADFIPDSSVRNTFHGLAVKIDEKPEPYNTSFPVSAGYSIKTTSSSYLTTDISFWWLNKVMYGTISLDSTSEHINLSQSLRQTCAAIDAIFHYEIPTHYFTVSGVEQTFFMAGVGIVPLARIWASTTYSQSSRNNARINNLSSALVNQGANVSAYGAGISWKIGVSTIKPVSGASNLEMGITFGGNLYNYFYQNSQRLTTGSINPKTASPLEPFTFSSNQLRVYCILLLGKKRPVESDSLGIDKKHMVRSDTLLSGKHNLLQQDSLSNVITYPGQPDTLVHNTTSHALPSIYKTAPQSTPDSTKVIIHERR